MTEDNLPKLEEITVPDATIGMSQFVKPEQASVQNDVPHGIWKKKFDGYIIAIPLGIVFQLLGIVLLPIGPIISPIGTVLLIYGLSKYAQKKGQNWIWGFAGILGLFGTFIVYFLKDLNKKVSIEKKPLNNFFRFLVYAIFILLCLFTVFGFIIFTTQMG